MRLGIVGGGTVGRATARAFMEWAEVRVYDVQPERCTHSMGEVLACDLVMVCLPTPQREDGRELDDRTVKEFFFALRGSRANLVLKSTVPIGTTRRLARDFDLPNLVHSPEFLTARCAMTDAQAPARNVIGIPGGEAGPCDEMLEGLYQDRFPGVPVHVMTSDESEAVKLIQNSFFMAKVAFFNEARSLVDELGLDWDRVLGGILADGRIAHSHTQVPGPDGRRGAGGGCLVKDSSEFVRALEELGLPCNVTAGALRRNHYDRMEG